jgi:hypothetical protein
MRHAKILAAVIVGVSAFSALGLAREQSIVIGEPVIDAVPELPPAATPGEIPGGLTDGAWKTAYVVGENGHTEAVDLKTGVTKFASATPAIPLCATGDTLYVLTCKVDPSQQKAEVVVRGMSVSGQGKYTFESKKIPVSEWLTTSYGSSMTATAKIERGKLILAWQANMDAYATAMGQNLIQFQRVRFAAQQAAVGNGAALDQANQAGMTLSEIDLATGEVKAVEKKEEAAQAQPAAQQVEEQAEFEFVNGPFVAAGSQSKASAAETRVTRDGFIYSLGAQSGQTQMSCQRIEDRRLLWTHPVRASRTLKTDVMAPDKPPAAPMRNMFRGCGMGVLELGC